MYERGPSLPVAAHFEPGVRVGEYTLIRSLGQGGFGAVYEAQHVERGARVALKILHPELGSSPEAALRFEREVEALRRIRHPHVITIFEQGRLEDGCPYFTMELLAGRSLQDEVAARGRLPPEEVAAILEPLCAAIGAAHEHAIIHRDIKASNVFLCEGGRVVLLDFGVAKLLDAGGPGLTTSRHLVGTLACLAPEQIMNGPIDARTDIYALGTLTYLLLTGELPFEARSQMALLQMHLYAAPRPPSARAPIGAGFNEVLLRALSKAPDDRHPTVKAFLAEFLRVSGRQGGDRAERRECIVYIEARVDPLAMTEPSARLLDDLDRVLSLSAAALGEAGFQVEMETAMSLLVSRSLPESPEDEAGARTRALDALRRLQASLERREGRDESVKLGFRAHLRRGAEELDAWRPEGSAEEVIASLDVVAGLDIPHRPVEGEEGFVRLQPLLEFTDTP